MDRMLKDHRDEQKNRQKIKFTSCGVKVMSFFLDLLRTEKTREIPQPLLLYILTSVWVLHTPNTGQNILFSVSQLFVCKNVFYR